MKIVLDEKTKLGIEPEGFCFVLPNTEIKVVMSEEFLEMMQLFTQQQIEEKFKSLRL